MPSVPKPVKVEKVRKYLPRSTKPLKRSWLKRGTKPIKQRNEARIARKAKAYRAVLAAEWHKKLRYAAYERSCSTGRSLCECEQCHLCRVFGLGVDNKRDVELAWREITIYFDHAAPPVWKRFHSKDGELHHMSYKHFGDENPAELHQVRWVHKSCHRRIEAEHGTRRRFLKGAKK